MILITTLKLRSQVAAKVNLAKLLKEQICDINALEEVKMKILVVRWIKKSMMISQKMKIEYN